MVDVRSVREAQRTSLTVNTSQLQLKSRAYPIFLSLTKEPRLTEFVMYRSRSSSILGLITWPPPYP
ncbi:hypothetical protein LIA77_11884 [Sarocladium implicatum]|nr:hypothetical protein LIA77_11884 [Sarocladium implicatum]